MEAVIESGLPKERTRVTSEPASELVQPAAEMAERSREENFNIHAGESYRKWQKTGEISDDLFTSNPPPQEEPLDPNDIEARLAQLNDKERYEWQLTGKLPATKNPQSAEEHVEQNGEPAGEGTLGEGESVLAAQDHTARYLDLPNRLARATSKDPELQRLQLQAASLPRVPIPDALRPGVEVFRHAFADLKNPELVHRYLALGEHGLVNQIYRALGRGVQGARAVVDTLRMLDKELPQALSKPQTAKTVTSAPPPPKELGGRGTAGVDPARQALDEDDFASYQRVMNARDTAPLRAARDRSNQRSRNANRR